MANWPHFATYFSAVYVLLLSISRTSVSTPDTHGDKLEVKNEKHDAMFVDSQSTLVLQLTPRHTTGITNVTGPHQAAKRQSTHKQATPNNIYDHLLQNSSNTSSPYLFLQSMKPLLLNERHSDENRILLTEGNINETEKPQRENVYSSGQTQTTKIKLRRIREKSETLIKRLCAVGASKRHVCYTSGASSCYCTGGLADCSGKPYVSNIWYAPKLPHDIKCLKFAYNNIRHLDESYFSNVSTFVVIDFSSNKLETISSKTFQRFTNLQYLILNDNVIGYRDLRAVLDYPPRHRLDIINLGLENVTAGYFNNYSTIPTSEIYMDCNYIRTLNLQEFSKLEHLKYLSLTNSRIDKVISAAMPNLKVLDLDNNYISMFPVTCNIRTVKSNSDSKATNLDAYHITSEKVLHISGEVSTQMKKHNDENEKFSLYPNLTDLYIGYNLLLALPAREEICLPRLKTLHMESNNVTNIPESAFTALRSLEVLTLANMSSGITKIGRSAFNISALTSLYLSKNRIPFGSNDISTKLFEGCTKLTILSIDHNQLGSVSEGDFEELLNHTPSLKSIYLSSTDMHFVPVKAFSQMAKIERLYLYVNEIKEIPPGAFDRMLSLRYLYMDENQISTVKENAFSLQTRRRLKAINLSRNGYLCDCNLLWFKSWLLQAGPTLFMKFDNYRCSNINNMSVQGYAISKQACLFSRETYILFVVCLSITMVLFIVFVLLYRYRWNIRLMIYERRAPRRNAINLSDKKHRYDVFVVYCNDDSHWVKELLIPMLETKWRLQACIHQRDFLAGGFIIDNIVETMNDSQRILVVISSRFALSNWCNFELQLCQSQVITHDLPSLLVVILDEVEPRDMCGALLALYTTTCFLEWPSQPSDPRDIDTFWKRLEKSLATVIGKRSHGTSVKFVE